MKTFIDQVIEDLRASSHDVTNLTYVVPSRRVAIFLTRSIASQLDKPVFQPAILSVEEFVEQLSGMSIKPDLDLLPLFYESYLQVQPKEEQETYDDFLGWAPTILKDFNEIDRYLVEPQDFFTFLGNVKELEDWHWSLGGEPTAMISNYLKFWKRLHLYYNSFTKICEEHNVAYQGLAYRFAFAKAETATQKLFKTPIIFLGLNALNKAESEIIQMLLNENIAEIYWDTDLYFLDRKYHEAGKFIREYQEQWKIYQNQPLKIVGAHFSDSKKVKISGVSGNIGMVQVAAQQLAQLQPEELKNTVVILADENLLLPLISALPENVENYNVTMGLSLDKLPISGFIQDLVKLFTEKTDKGFYFKNLNKFLESPFTNLLISKPSTHYTRLIAQSNLVYVQQSDISDDEDDVIRQILSTQTGVKPILFLVDQLIIQIKTNLIGKTDSRMELEQLLGLSEVMGSLERLLNTGREIEDLRTLSFMLRQLLPLKKLDFIGEPVKGLQIMGLLETRALDYKNVIMLSVNEGVLPAGKSTASYIPHDMKRKFDLPTYSEKDSVYAYHFYRLLHRVENACFIYNTEPGKLGGAEKSRFLVQLETNEGVQHEVQSLDYIYKNEAISNQLLSIEKTGRYFERLNEIAKKGFSPSALTSYVRNPIDFYKQKILGISQLDEVEESIALNTMGSIIHEALDKLYVEHLNKELHENDFKEMKSRQLFELDKAYKKYYPSSSKPSGRNRIIYEVASQFIKKMLGMDLKLIKAGRKLIIKSVEQHLEVNITIEAIGVVKLHGMVDRVDELDGALRIIDYKTGSVAKGDIGLEPDNFEIMREDYKKAKAFQILMYAYLFMKNDSTVSEVTAGMISFKKFQDGFISFGLKPGRSYVPETITIETLEQFEEQLKLLLIEIFDKEKPLTEKEV